MTGFEVCVGRLLVQTCRTEHGREFFLGILSGRSNYSSGYQLGDEGVCERSDRSQDEATGYQKMPD
jgi:hypothetical protein